MKSFWVSICTLIAVVVLARSPAKNSEPSITWRTYPPVSDAWQHGGDFRDEDIDSINRKLDEIIDIERENQIERRRRRHEGVE